MSDAPFDLDAAVGAVEAKPFRFVWGGQTHELPAIMALPVDRQLAIVATIEGLGEDTTDPTKIANALKVLVGERLLADLSAVKPLSTAALMGLLSAWMTDQGVDVGKSPASAPSSASTAKPSRQTSRSPRVRKTS